MIAALRLFGARDDFVHLRLVFGDYAVDSLKHLVLFVAAIVAARDTCELDDADLRRMLYVGTAAHLDIVADRIRRNILALGNVRQTLELVFLPGEHIGALLARNDLSDKRLVKRYEALYLGLDFREIFGRKSVRQIKVVVKPLVCGGTDVNLNVLEHILDRACRQVRSAVASHLFCQFGHISPCNLRPVLYHIFYFRGTTRLIDLLPSASITCATARTPSAVTPQMPSICSAGSTRRPNDSMVDP